MQPQFVHYILYGPHTTILHHNLFLPRRVMSANTKKRGGEERLTTYPNLVFPHSVPKIAYNIFAPRQLQHLDLLAHLSFEIARRIELDTFDRYNKPRLLVLCFIHLPERPNKGGEGGVINKVKKGGYVIAAGLPFSQLLTEGEMGRRIGIAGTMIVEIDMQFVSLKVGYHQGDILIGGARGGQHDIVLYLILPLALGLFPRRQRLGLDGDLRYVGVVRVAAGSEPGRKRPRDLPFVRGLAHDLLDEVLVTKKLPQLLSPLLLQLRPLKDRRYPFRLASYPRPSRIFCRPDLLFAFMQFL